jgi:hypothetical protein
MNGRNVKSDILKITLGVVELVDLQKEFIFIIKHIEDLDRSGMQI